MATVTLPIHVMVKNRAIILKKRTQGKWEEIDVAYVLSDGAVRFQISHFCWFIAVLKRFIPWSWNIMIQNSIYYNNEKAQFCGFTCVQDDALIKTSEDTLEKKGYRSALLFPDNISVKPHERISYSLQIKYPEETDLDPNEEIEIAGCTIKTQKMEAVEFSMMPTPRPNIKTLRLTYSLKRPNMKPKSSSLALAWNDVQEGVAAGNIQAVVPVPGNIQAIAPGTSFIPGSIPAVSPATGNIQATATVTGNVQVPPPGDIQVIAPVPSNVQGTATVPGNVQGAATVPGNVQAEPPVVSYFEAALPTGSSIPAAASPNVREPTSDVENFRINESSEGSYREHLTENTRIYQIEPNRQKGRVLIINNKFQGSDHERRGSEVDVRNMDELWQSLGFDVVSTGNLGAQEMLRACREFASDTENVSVLVTVIMSHGGTNAEGKDYFCGEDSEPALIDDVISIFPFRNYGRLVGIPKIFVFQACRVGARDVERTDTLPQVTPPAPERVDMLIIYSTQPGSAAMRNEVHGTWLMNDVTNIFMEHAHSIDVLGMSTMVNDAVSKRGEPTGDLQISSQESCLRKQLFLFPGWP